ncbi:SRPBCC family protein [Nitriliruptor alkaliphilus]|uniref:SRPBCC family protein n=1 Tax=Nitriliruptor alkaliphilus TaxID=427918 RepID=UPI000696AFCB|nr:SRPBCC family protein [Nitriliruptor alkaliphilus]
MRITDRIEVPQPPDEVWRFFDDIPQVAACLPGTTLNEQEGENRFTGEVVISAGPVRLEFEGAAEIVDRDEAARTLQVEASGADRKGRGQAALLLDAAVSPGGPGTVVDIALDLTLSGAAAQYGRGMVSDVTAVLLEDFAGNVRSRLDAISQGLDPDTVATGKPASGFAFVLRATRLALMRVFRRFFLPYQPPPSRSAGPAMRR